MGMSINQSNALDTCIMGTSERFLSQPMAGCEKSRDCNRTPCSYSSRVVDLQWIFDIY